MHKLLEPVIDIAIAAGEAIIEVAQSADINIQKKADKSPVTEADLRANALITERLATLAPDIPIISEEDDEVHCEQRLSWPRCWLVDPLDGTRGFIDGSGEYTVNIALIENHQPVLGVIYAPQLNQQLYYAVRGQGAFSRRNGNDEPLQFKPFDTQRTLKVAVSQYHRSRWLDDLLSDIPKYELVRMNSSVKICFVAQGVADIYPRLGPTSEWDTAAGQCIVEEAGGAVLNLDGEPLSYNARSTLENPGFIVIGDLARKQFFLDLIQRVRRDK